MNLNNQRKLLHHFLQVHQYYFRIFLLSPPGGVKRDRTNHEI
ncbi:MAG: hypothetical protein V7K25_16000 [Nostoc sp.]